MEECCSLDVGVLNRKGVLKPGLSFTASWFGAGREVSSIAGIVLGEQRPELMMLLFACGRERVPKGSACANQSNSTGLRATSAGSGSGSYAPSSGAAKHLRCCTLLVSTSYVGTATGSPTRVSAKIRPTVPYVELRR